jgi:S1/P1 Nuclease
VLVPIRTALFILLITLSAPSFAWGPEGHQIAADIARSRLTDATRRHIRELLGNDDLAAISTWADEVRAQRPETFGWHFVDIPMSATGFSQQRDCYRPGEKYPPAQTDHHNCVVDRIEIVQRVLADKNESPSNRVEALKFLVHFVADIHQPLHAIGEARGGNDIHISEFGSSQCGTGLCNLHSAWDTGLIEHTRRSELEYLADLEKLIARQPLWRDADGTPETWANESFHLAQEVWLRDGGKVDEAYFRRNIESLNERLALAGLRLANMLNQALGR